MNHDTIPDEFYTRDTIRTTPMAPDPLRHVRDSLRPPRTPSRLGPYTTGGEVGLVLFAVAGAASCLYLGFEWARHWAIGGWLGVEWFASIVVAAGLAGAGLATAIMMRGVRRG